MRRFITDSGQLDCNRPVLSTHCSSYKILNILLSPFFEKLPGANIENNPKDARAALEATRLDVDELFVSLDVKSVYTNVPEIALKELYSSDEVPGIQRSAMKNLLRLAVTNAHFKCNKIWYGTLNQTVKQWVLRWL